MRQLAHEHGSVLSELREGWIYIRGFRPIWWILLLLALISLVGMPYTTLMPIFAGRILHGGAHTLGFLMAATGVGALIGAVRLAARRSVLGIGPLDSNDRSRIWRFVDRVLVVAASMALHAVAGGYRILLHAANGLQQHHPSNHC